MVLAGDFLQAFEGFGFFAGFFVAGVGGEFEEVAEFFGGDACGVEGAGGVLVGGELEGVAEGFAAFFRAACEGFFGVVGVFQRGGQEEGEGGGEGFCGEALAQFGGEGGALGFEAGGEDVGAALEGGGHEGGAEVIGEHVGVADLATGAADFSEGGLDEGFAGVVGEEAGGFFEAAEGDADVVDGLGAQRCGAFEEREEGCVTLFEHAREGVVKLPAGGGHRDILEGGKGMGQKRMGCGGFV